MNHLEHRNRLLLFPSYPFLVDQSRQGPQLLLKRLLRQHQAPHLSDKNARNSRRLGRVRLGDHGTCIRVIVRPVHIEVWWCTNNTKVKFDRKMIDS